MKHYLFILLFVVLSAFVFSQTPLKYPSLLWKITGNGIKKEGYLYGTTPASNRVAYHLSDQFFDALNKSEVVGLETNPADWLNNMELMGELGKASGVGIFNPY
ncbi:MAG: TraB/GumN family protein, partial [Bacteroidia bacterium]|nr:TraB/GumN family protein [Bacteroidia bacterium]